MTKGIPPRGLSPIKTRPSRSGATSTASTSTPERSASASSLPEKTASSAVELPPSARALTQSGATETSEPTSGSAAPRSPVWAIQAARTQRASDTSPTTPRGETSARATEAPAEPPPPEAALSPGKSGEFRSKLDAIRKQWRWSGSIEQLTAGLEVAGDHGPTLDRGAAHALRSAAEASGQAVGGQWEKTMNKLVETLDHKLDADLTRELDRHIERDAHGEPSRFIPLSTGDRILPAHEQIVKDLGRAPGGTTGETAPIRSSLLVQDGDAPPYSVPARESHEKTVGALFELMKNVIEGQSAKKLDPRVVDQKLQLAMAASTQTFDAGITADFISRAAQFDQLKLPLQDSANAHLATYTFAVEGTKLSVHRQIPFRIHDGNTGVDTAHFLLRRTVEFDLAGGSPSREKYAYVPYTPGHDPAAV